MEQIDNLCEGIKIGLGYSDSDFYYSGMSHPHIKVELMEKAIPKVTISGIKEEPLDLYIRELIHELQSQMLTSSDKKRAIRSALEQFSEVKFKDKNWWGSISNSELESLIKKVSGVHSSQTLMLSEGLKDAYLFGKLHSVLTESDSLNKARKKLANYKQSAIDQASIKHIDETANIFWDRAISREADPISIRLLQSNRDATTEVLKTYFKDPKKSWRSVSSDIYNSIQKSDRITSRDIDRITLTEISNAQNNGILTSLHEQGRKTFFVIVRPTACKVCKGMYLNPDGTPKKFSVQELLLVPRDANWGKRKGDELVPQMPSLHPFCFCRISS